MLRQAQQPLKARIELASGFEILAPAVEEKVHEAPVCRVCGGPLRYRYSILPRTARVTNSPPEALAMN